MCITVNYAALHLETLQVILTMHENDYAQLLNCAEAPQEKLQNLQFTIEQVKQAIREKETNAVI